MEILLTCPRCDGTAAFRSHGRERSRSGRLLGRCGSCGSMFSLFGGRVSEVEQAIEPRARVAGPSSVRSGGRGRPT